MTVSSLLTQTNSSPLFPREDFPTHSEPHIHSICHGLKNAHGIAKYASNTLHIPHRRASTNEWCAKFSFCRTYWTVFSTVFQFRDDRAAVVMFLRVRVLCVLYRMYKFVLPKSILSMNATQIIYANELKTISMQLSARPKIVKVVLLLDEGTAEKWIWKIKCKLRNEQCAYFHFQCYVNWMVIAWTIARQWYMQMAKQILHM